MKKIVSFIAIIGIMCVLIISNGTVEAAKKKENAQIEKQIISVEKETQTEILFSYENVNKEKENKNKVKEEKTSPKQKNIEKNLKDKKTEETKLVKKAEEKEAITKRVEDYNVDGKVTRDDFFAIVAGVEIGLGTDINDVIDELGEPDDFVQARSCLHDGDDKIYTFGGIIIYTYPDEKKDIVYIIEYTGEELTPAGIGIGSSMKEVEAAYGNDYTEDAFFTTYELNENATISFQIVDGKVEYIEFYME